MVNDRNRVAFELRAKGKTLREIGEALGGVSAERARQMIKGWERHLAAPSADGIWNEARREGVKPRTINSLKRANLFTKKEIRAAIVSGNGIPEIGKSGIQELRTWLRMAAPEPTPPSEGAVKAAITLLRRAGYEIDRE